MVLKDNFKSTTKGRISRHWKRFVTLVVIAGLLPLMMQGVVPLSVQAQTSQSQLNRFCQLPAADAERKESLRLASLQGDEAAQQQYEAIRRRHSQALQTCRQQNWPRNQAIWLRLYPCDLQPGRLDAVMDKIVNLGYNEVYIEAFANGQVLLPKNDNPTVWPSVVQSSADADRDLLAEAIAAARKQSIKPYAWMFTINFGYSYGQKSRPSPCAGSKSLRSRYS